MLREISKRIKYRIFPFILYLLKKSAEIKLQRLQPKIVGVAGSIGKSSFLNLLDIAVRDNFNTKTTFHGNSETGLPLEILGIRSFVKHYSLLEWITALFVAPASAILAFPTYELLVVEMGIDSPLPPKNMQYLLTFLRPDIGVLLSVAPVHTEQFAKFLGYDSLRDREKILFAIAKEKGLLLTSLPKGKTAIFNTDSPYIIELASQIQAKKVTFGKDRSAMYRVQEIVRNDNGSSVKISCPNQQKVEFEIKNYVLADEYGNILAAVLATANELGLLSGQVVSKIEKGFALPPGRMSLIKGVRNTKIIDSSYNSSPDSLRSALEMFSKLPVPLSKRILVLGDMRELGPLAANEHKKIAKYVVAAGSNVVLIGFLMEQYLYPELLRIGFPKDKIQIFKSSNGVAAFIKKNVIKDGDWILVKGSQNTIFLERTVKELMKNPETAEQLLCRQGTFWDKIRNQQTRS